MNQRLVRSVGRWSATRREHSPQDWSARSHPGTATSDNFRISEEARSATVRLLAGDRGGAIRGSFACNVHSIVPVREPLSNVSFPEKTLASGRTSVVAVIGEPAMLWWFIGAWLGSAAIIPILWLLSVAYPGIFSPGTEVQQKHAVSEPPSPAPWRLSLQVGRYTLAGLFTVAGLVLAFVGLSSDPPVTMTGLISSSSPGDAQATPPQFASAGPTPSPIPLSAAHLPAEPAQAEAINESGDTRHEPPLSDEAGQITSSGAVTSLGGATRRANPSCEPSLETEAGCTGGVASYHPAEPWHVALARAPIRGWID
jgi:hypothetical protein